MYVSMAVQVPTVPSARARGASMHSMTIATIYTEEMGMSNGYTEATLWVSQCATLRLNCDIWAKSTV